MIALAAYFLNPANLHFTAMPLPDWVEWADTIFVMEAEHLEKLQDRFGEELAGKKIVCLHIRDIYRYMEPALIVVLKAALSGHVEAPE
jgi:predicted protein tyrosine phosphatase